MNKRKKYGIIFSVVVFILVFIITFVLSIELNKVYERNGEISYSIKTIKQIQPFNYNISEEAFYIWFIGIIIMCISLYVAFVKKKEKVVNKAQIIVLATITPIILFISFLAPLQLLSISALADAWFFVVIILIIIAIFEYDLFGNKIIIFFFDFKLIIKMFILFIILIFITTLLSEVISPFIKTTTSPITKEKYENYKGEKFDWYSLPKPTYKP